MTSARFVSTVFQIITLGLLAGCNRAGYSTVPLATPSGFSTSAISSSSISFAWTDNANNEDGYQVERCTGAACANFTTLASSLPRDTVGYVDGTVASGTTYIYRIRAFNTSTASSYLTGNSLASSLGFTTAASCSASTNVILDYGVKAATSLATSARGLASDVKYMPSSLSTASSAVTGAANGIIVNDSANVGVAYVDTGSQSIKYSYWNGTVFKTEIIAGDVVANVTNIQLAYLSNSTNLGRALVFWTNGAANNGQIMMAVRGSTSLTAAATWTVRAIDTDGGASNRALQVAVNPIDQVALVYQAQTTPAMRFISCGSDCHDPANYVAMPVGNRLDVASVAAEQKVGVAWCQHASGAYSPGVFYGTSATTFTYSSCLAFASSPSSCLAAGGWARSTTPITTGAASGKVADVFIDPSILKDTPKIVVKDNATGLKMYALPSCDTFTAGTAYVGPSASTILASNAANTASSWLKILKSRDYVTAANERYQVVFNDGITDMRWATTNASNSFTGSWLFTATATSSIHNNAALLAAAGTTTMGAALNTTTDQLITSYGNSIANNFNITLGIVGAFTSSSPASATNTYSQIPVESTGGLQLNATQYKNVAVAATTTSRPAVAWVDFSSGTYTTGRLKYALRTSALASGSSWNTISVPSAISSSATSPLYPSLAFDNSNRPWIGYWDQTSLRFVLATNTESDGSGTWSSYLFPIAGAVSHGAPVAQPAMNSTAIAMYVSGGVYYPVMIVIDNTSTLTKAVKSAKFNPTNGTWSAVSNIDATLLAGGAAFLKTDFNAAGTIVVAYQNLGAGNIRVKYDASTDGGATWPTNGSSPASVSGLNQGEGVEIKLKPTTGLPSLSYYDRANGKLYFASCTANCTGSGVPAFSGTSTAALNGTGITGLSGTGNVNLLSAALTYSDSGDASILYNSGQLDFGNLRSIDDSAGAMGSALPATIVSGANGTYNSNAAGAANGGIPWGQQAVRLANGVFATAYITPGNWLGVTTCGD